jgi:hypothetical protein
MFEEHRFTAIHNLEELVLKGVVEAHKAGVLGDTPR